MSWTYRAFQFSLRSNLPIPGLTTAEPSATEADIQVYFGASAPVAQISDADSAPTYTSPYLDESGRPNLRIWRLADGKTYQLCYTNGLLYWLNPQEGIIWAKWTDDSSVEDSVGYLLGPVLGILLRLRGETCLHASAVSVEDRAFLFVGPPGAGKSTLAAAFNCRGYAAISDDIALLREDRSCFRVIPAHPFLSLWPESLTLIDRPSEGLPRVFPKFEKRRLLLTDSANRFEKRALRLGAIYILGDRNGVPESYIEQLSLGRALISLISNTYATYVLDSEKRAREFEILGRLTSNVPIRRVYPKATTASLNELCNLIQQDY